jgi:hypothetical protein
LYSKSRKGADLVQLNIEQLSIYLPILTMYYMIGYLFLPPSQEEAKKKVDGSSGS